MPTFSRMHEFAIEDCNGYRLSFGQPTDAPPTVTEDERAGAGPPAGDTIARTPLSVEPLDIPRDLADNPAAPVEGRRNAPDASASGRRAPPG